MQVWMGDEEAEWLSCGLGDRQHMAGARAYLGADTLDRPDEALDLDGLERLQRKRAEIGATDAAIAEGAKAPGVKWEPTNGWTGRSVATRRDPLPNRRQSRVRLQIGRSPLVMV